MTDYLATIKGTWDPGSIGALDYAAYYGAAQAASQATRSAIGYTSGWAGFHIVATRAPGGPVYRSRWKIQAMASGPALRPQSADPHDSQVNLLLRTVPFGGSEQVVYDDLTLNATPEAPMPFQGVLHSVVAALLLRAAWGAGPRSITVGSYGTGMFTPTELVYAAPSGAEVTLPYGDPAEDLAEYRINQMIDGDAPAVWLVTADRNWKISYVVADPNSYSAADRWDTPDEPAPAFTALREPKPTPPPPPGPPPSD